jgi:hypothetical protein
LTKVLSQRTRAPCRAHTKKSGGQLAAALIAG